MIEMLDAVELTKKFIQFNTINPPGNEKILADYIQNIFKDSGFDILEHIFDDNRSGLLITLEGEDKSQPPLAFTGHLDTVPIGNIPWSHEPLAGFCEGDKILGRGSSDMKSGLAAFLAAVYNHKNILQKSHGVVCILTACEELACKGAKKMVADDILPQSTGPLIIAEPTGNYIHNGHKGVFWTKLSFRGVSAHGSMPHEGQNAIENAIEFIQRLKEHLAQIPRHSDFGVITFNIGTINGGSAINLVADSCQIELDIRLTPHFSLTQAKDLVESLRQDYATEIEILEAGDCVYTPKENPALNAFAQSVKQIGGDGKIRNPLAFFTDGSPLLTALNPTAAFVCGPGEAEQCHKVNEFAYISKIKKSYDIYSQFIMDYAHQN